MAVVTVLSAAKTLELVNISVVSGVINASGHLILTKYDGTQIDAGYMLAIVPDASDIAKGVVELATNAETQTGTDAIRAVTPASLASRVSSDILAGLVELATNAETQTGTDATRAVTPASLASRIASDILAGLVELATNAETQAGTDATRAVTPAGLDSVLASTYRYVQTVKYTASGTFVKASYPGVKAIRVRMVGGGGAGGGAGAAAAGAHSCGGGGGGAGYAEKFILASTLAASETVTIGAGGVGANAAIGGNGGTSSFGVTKVQAGGGIGGLFVGSNALAVTALGGDSGWGNVGDLLLDGCPGGSGGGNATLGNGGFGGASRLGGGASGVYTAAGSAGSLGINATGYGAGGGGGATNANGPAVSGGSGGAGIILVEVYQ